MGIFFFLFMCDVDLRDKLPQQPNSESTHRVWAQDQGWSWGHRSMWTTHRQLVKVTSCQGHPPAYNHPSHHHHHHHHETDKHHPHAHSHSRSVFQVWWVQASKAEALSLLSASLHSLWWFSLFPWSSVHFNVLKTRPARTARACVHACMCALKNLNKPHGYRISSHHIHEQPSCTETLRSMSVRAGLPGNGWPTSGLSEERAIINHTTGKIPAHSGVLTVFHGPDRFRRMNKSGEGEAANGSPVYPCVSSQALRCISHTPRRCCLR